MALEDSVWASPGRFDGNGTFVDVGEVLELDGEPVVGVNTGVELFGHAR